MNESLSGTMTAATPGNASSNGVSDISGPINGLYHAVPPGSIRLMYLTGSSLVEHSIRRRKDLAIKDLAIDYELRIVSLSDVQNRYQALSYCWGSSAGRSRYVRCNGTPIPIRQNLYNALWNRAFCGDSELPLWVDAICINQADDNERTEQVGIMKNIFRQADSVLVWLGTGEDVLDQGMHEYWEWLSNRCPIEERPEAAVAAGERYIFDNVWFQRVWTFQEVVLASRVIFNIGTHSFTWKSLLIACRWSDHLYQKWQLRGHRSRSPVLEQIETLRKSLGTSSLLSLLRMTRARQATDPRDKLFAVLGLYQGSYVRPDYTKTYEDVNKLACQILVHEERALGVLCAGVPLRIECESLKDHLMTDRVPTRVTVTQKELQTRRVLGLQAVKNGPTTHYDVGPLFIRKHLAGRIDCPGPSWAILDVTRFPKQRLWYPDVLTRPERSLEKSGSTYLASGDILDDIDRRIGLIYGAGMAGEPHQIGHADIRRRGDQLVASGIVIGRWIAFRHYKQETIFPRNGHGSEDHHLPNWDIDYVPAHDPHHCETNNRGHFEPLPACILPALGVTREEDPLDEYFFDLDAEVSNMTERGAFRPSDSSTYKKINFIDLCHCLKQHDAHLCKCEGFVRPLVNQLSHPSALEYLACLPFGASHPIVVRPDFFDDELLSSVKMVARVEGMQNYVSWPFKPFYNEQTGHLTTDVKSCVDASRLPTIYQLHIRHSTLRSSLGPQVRDYGVTQMSMSSIHVDLEIAEELAPPPEGKLPGHVPEEGIRSVEWTGAYAPRRVDSSQMSPTV